MTLPRNSSIGMRLARCCAAESSGELAPNVHVQVKMQAQSMPLVAAALTSSTMTRPRNSDSMCAASGMSSAMSCSLQALSHSGDHFNMELPGCQSMVVDSKLFIWLSLSEQHTLCWLPNMRQADW